MDLKEEEILGDKIGDHWYYQSKAKAMERALDGLEVSTALDIGSGSGFFASHLLQNSDIQQIDCVDTSYEADGEETFAGGKVLRQRRDLNDALTGVDLAVLMDVCEHVEDDTGLLRATVERVAPGGHVFVTVPAFQWLWSGHDDFLGHVRRYTLPEVEALFERAGLVVDSGHYFFGLVFPAAAAQRLVGRRSTDQKPASKLKVYSPVLNGVLKGMSSMETFVQSWNRLGGLSVVVLGHRP